MRPTKIRPNIEQVAASSAPISLVAMPDALPTSIWYHTSGPETRMLPSAVIVNGAGLSRAREIKHNAPKFLAESRCTSR